MDPQALLGLKEVRVLKAHKEILVRRGLQEVLVLPAQLDPQALRVPMEILDQQVQSELQGHKGHKD